jgi:hypothetical protein
VFSALIADIMEALGTAAAVIGIADVGLRGIKGLYDFFQKLEEVPAQLAQIRSEIADLQTRLSGLEFLSMADEETLNEVKNTGITKSINDCGSACENFEKQLARWVKHGPDSFRNKLRVVWHGAKIDNCKFMIWSTARVLDSAVGILTL